MEGNKQLKIKFFRMLAGPFLVAVLIGVGFNFALDCALAWDEPTADPPGNNVAKPINEGSENQTKIGNLTLTNLCFDSDCRDSWASVSGFWQAGTGGIYYNSGNVGIGATTPNYARLLIQTDGSVEGLHITRTASGANAYLNIENESASPIFKVHESGNVGIGKATPAEKLDVVGNIVASGTICDSVGCISSGGGSGDSGWTDDGTVVRLTTATDYVGVGTVSPNSSLHVYRTSGNNAEIDIQSVSGVGNHWGIYQVRDDNVLTFNSNESGDLRFWAAGADLITISDDGGKARLGVNTPSSQPPTAEFHVYSGEQIGSPRTYVNSGYYDGFLVNSYWLDNNSPNAFDGYVDLVAGRSSTGSLGGSQFRFFTQPRSTADPIIAVSIDRNQNVFVSENLYVGNISATDDDYIYFDNGAESISWDESPGEFDISDDINIEGDLILSSGGTINTDTADGSDNAYTTITSGGLSTNIFNLASRGASIAMFGNEFSLLPDFYGSMYLVAGNNPSGGDMYFVTGGGNTMAVTYEKNIGVGTTTPAVKLVVGSGNSTDTVGNIISIEGVVGSYTGYRIGQAGSEKWFFGMDNGATGRLVIRRNSATNDVIINSAGSVGIGVSSPSSNYKLDIGGAIRLNGLSAAPTAAAGVMYFNSTEGKFKCSQDGSTWVDCVGSGSGSSNVANGTLAGQTLRWDGSAWAANGSLFNSGTNIGIGTTAPTDAKLVINSQHSQLQLIDSDDNNYTHFSYSSDVLAFRMNTLSGTPVLTLKDDNTVGIGTINPTQRLDVVGNIKLSGDFYVSDDKSIRIDSASGDTDIFIGNYGDGSSFGYSTTYKANLAVEGDVKGNQLCIENDCIDAWSDVSGSSLPVGSANQTLRYNGSLVSWEASSLLINNGTSIGIGTDSPSAKLHVIVGSAVGSEEVKVDGNTVGNTYLTLDTGANRRAAVRFNSSGVTQWSIGRGDSDELLSSSFYIGTGSTGGANAKLVINSDGYVGIGATAPNKQLHVKTASGNAEIDIQSGSSNYWGIYQDDATDELRFWHNGSNRVVFFSSGAISVAGKEIVNSSGNLRTNNLAEEDFSPTSSGGLFTIAAYNNYSCTQVCSNRGLTCKTVMGKTNFCGDYDMDCNNLINAIDVQHANNCKDGIAPYDSDCPICANGSCITECGNSLDVDWDGDCDNDDYQQVVDAANNKCSNYVPCSDTNGLRVCFCE